MTVIPIFCLSTDALEAEYHRNIFADYVLGFGTHTNAFVTVATFLCLSQAFSVNQGEEL
jgi:hypothetical protein